MFQVKLNLLPEQDALQETARHIPLDDLGLGATFTGGTIEADYDLRRLDNKVHGRFHLRGLLKLSCARCLEEFTKAVETDFMVEFAPRPAPSGLEKDLEDPGPNWVWFDGEELPVGEEMRQEMELLVPVAPLCQSGCQGLCPLCGSNRNTSPCGCEPQKSDSPFASLQEIFPRPKEN